MSDTGTPKDGRDKGSGTGSDRSATDKEKHDKAMKDKKGPGKES